MNSHTLNSVVILAGLSCSFATQTAAATPYVITEVMSGLVTPRGLAFGPDGGLYVAEAGSGGNGPSVVLGNGNTAFLGDSSGLSRLLGGIQTRVLNGLPSVATATGLDAGGLQDIAFDGSGQAYGLFSFGSDSMQRNTNLGAAGAALGTIARLPLGPVASFQHIADVAAHEFSANPAGGAIDSNPFRFALAPGGGFLVADAGANDFLNSTIAGVVTTLGVLPAKPNPLPFGPPFYQSVPTAIEVGPDGAYYIGQLTGFPFPPGTASIFRFDPTTSAITEAFTGFTNIIDLTIDENGMLYVLQVSSNGLASPMGPGSGLLIQIDPTTGVRTTIASSGLVFPGAVAAGPDGALYVTNHSNLPTGGQVLRIAAVPEPSSWVMAACGLLGLAAFARWPRRAWILLLVGAATWPAADCRAASLSVMTFNVRFDSGNASGINSWYNPATPSAARRLKVFDVIHSSAPDILGLQEPQAHQVADLNGQYNPGEGLLAYEHYAVQGGNSEYTPIFYLRDRFTRVDQGVFSISTTPDILGATFPGASQPRMATWVVLNDHATGQSYFVLNTHLDHVSAEARTFGGQLIQSKLQELSGGLPVLVLGDFNDYENSWALQALTAPADAGAIALDDSYRQVHPVYQVNEATYHGFDGRPYGARIDYVLNSADFTPESASIIRTSYGGNYPSDHFPVLATFQVAPVPEPATTTLLGSALLTIGTVCSQRRRRGCRTE
jgi:endonuclease/exonuclease/phosphatase family metal-dependent hydrolase